MHLLTHIGALDVEVSSITPASNPMLRHWETCVFWPNGTSRVVYLQEPNFEQHHHKVVAAVENGELLP